jgi:hypothetical protein
VSSVKDVHTHTMIILSQLNATALCAALLAIPLNGDNPVVAIQADVDSFHGGLIIFRKGTTPILASLLRSSSRAQRLTIKSVTGMRMLGI